MKQYLNLVRDVLENGSARSDRTGTGTLSLFGKRLEFDLQEGFPAVTTKKLAFKSMIGELLWFMSGETTISDLKKRTFGSPDSDKSTIWDANQKDFASRISATDDDCGKIYGYQWHKSNQLRQVVNRLIDNPTDRRLLVSAWDVDIVDDPCAMALPPCHYAFQFYVRGPFLDLMWSQRSGDVFLGIPYNSASYAALVHIVAAMTGLIPGKLIGNIGDTHIYSNHIKQVEEQLSRTPYKLPDLVLPEWLTSNKPIGEKWNLLYNCGVADQFSLKNYQCHPSIKAPMAV